MGKLTAAARKAVPKSKFGLPGKKTKSNPTGKGGYPMPDKKHAAIAKGYAKRFASPAQRAKIDAKANAILKKGAKRGKKLGMSSKSSTY